MRALQIVDPTLQKTKASERDVVELVHGLKQIARAAQWRTGWARPLEQETGEAVRFAQIRRILSVFLPPGTTIDGVNTYNYSIYN